MEYQLPADLKGILAALAETVLPLASWLQRKQYAPISAALIPQLNSLPWRPPQGAPQITTGALKTMEFFADLFDHDHETEELAKRWQELTKDPLANFQPSSGTAAAWRKDRTLP